tara:strand:+ start:3017 stop:3709 length:693 start_codon:yes stop_codon:yes gene_type:complete
MPYLISDIPYFKCWVRKEFTNNHEEYHGEYLHANAIAVNTIPDRCLSFQVVFTGNESEFYDTDNVHGGAMWARMPITALVADDTYESFEDFPEKMETYLAQPWDCSSHNHAIVKMERVSSSPWQCKIDGEWFTAQYMFTVDYTESHIADDAAQHKQSHVLQLLSGEWKGNIVALPNNRVRATSPALWETGQGAPDFKPSQFLHAAEIHESYLDPEETFNNMYANEDNKGD